MRPLASFIVTSYNGTAYVAAAIRSVLSQSIRDIEVLVVDDGSNEPTRQILEELAREDSRLRLFLLAHGGGARSLNHGLVEALSPYVLILDHDDIAVPQRTELQLAFMAANPEVVLAGGGITTIDRHGVKLDTFRFANQPALLYDKVLSASIIAHPTVIMRREAALRVGGYRPYFQSSVDADLILRMAEVGDLANLPDVLTYYRLHAGQMSKQRRLQRACGDFARLLARSNRAGHPVSLRQATSGPEGLLAFRETDRKEAARLLATIADYPS